MTQELYAVTGATGAQGGAAARALLRADLPVRALTRDPNAPAAVELRALGAEVVRADFDDPATLRAELAGASGLFAMSTPFGTDCAVETRQGIALLDAAAAAGVGHVVLTSAANADRGTGIPHFESKWLIEQHLHTLGPSWTVLGPGVFLENCAGEWTLQSLRRGVFGYPLPVDHPLPVIAAADIGAVAALALARPERFAGRRIDLAGQWSTPARQAAAIGAAVGRPVAVEEVPISVVEGYSADLAAMFRHFREVGLQVDVEGLHREFPEVRWHTMERWAAERSWDL
ncbi:NmrA family NAD(P)-binding protein [Kitasatospora sp. LaBMicrA B282]|uniref:NmrA family NAD(P)-binding protein n=1 Tax=Kitasatospora sp. LaBMicrA B282 TaxID=3420949 RepID=UPI003D138CE6